MNYCYKIKRSYLKYGAYKRAKIESLGFTPMFDQDGAWALGWAKSVILTETNPVSAYVKKTLEDIYKKEIDKPDSPYLKQLKSEYEFDSEGKIINFKPVETQICVFGAGENKGLLFINLSGTVEFYEYNTLNEAVPDEIKLLTENEVGYKDVYRD